MGSFAFIGDTGCTVGTGRTTITLSGSALTNPVTHRTHAAALTAGDIVDGSVHRWTVYKSDGNYSTITGTFNDGSPDTISSITWEDEVGTISATDSVAIIMLDAAVTLLKEVSDTVYAISGTTPAIDPANGCVQTWTLTGNSTPTDSLTDGQIVELHIDDGTAYTITWTSLVGEWIGGSAPTLDATNTTIVVLEKVGSTVIGQTRGVAS